MLDLNVDTKGGDMARPKKDARDVKSYSLRVRLTVDDVNKIRDLAKQKKLSVSDLVRACVLGDKTG
jgi:hypothetical protein